MKKLLLVFSVLLICSSSVFSQENLERKLGIKPMENPELLSITTGNVDCKCANSILQDGGFQKLTDNPGSTDIAASSFPWKPGWGSPQWVGNVQGACNTGVVYMWGNKGVGESIYQNSIPLVAGKTYKLKFTARFHPSGSSTFVGLRAFFFSGGSPSTYYGPTGTASDAVSSVNISSTSWETYTTTCFTALSGENSLALHPENNSSANDGAQVSWIDIDNVCLEECCAIPDAQCNPKFTITTSLNSLCNIVVNAVPVVTAGAEHYWGLVAMPGGCNTTPIPASTILSGGTFGVHVSSTGVVTPIGMGTGITGGTTGYGYNYQGVSNNICFKITHYIKCCNKWYSQTNCYCPKDCPYTETAGQMTEVKWPD